MIDSSSESGDENKARRKERPLRKEDKSLGDVLLKSESSDLFVTAVDLNVTGCVTDLASITIYNRSRFLSQFYLHKPVSGI